MQGDGQRERQAPPPAFKPAAGERELMTGLLSKNASFRLVVSGDVGVKEIERLIAKLQLDKEILADLDSDTVGSTGGLEDAPPDKAQVSFFITNAQKVELRKQGYSDDDIAKLKPAEAHKLLKIT
jgi:hypothetical protein